LVCGDVVRMGRVQREMGAQISRDHPALDERLGRVRALPGLRPRDPQDHLHR